MIYSAGIGQYLKNTALEGGAEFFALSKNDVIIKNIARNINMPETLPPSFDPEIYCHEIGISMTAENAWLHFCSHGKQSGTVCSAIRGESDFLNTVSKLGTNGILEIGPGANPRMKADNVEYYDVQDSKEMIGWATKHNYSTSRIPQRIHYVSKEADMSVITKTYNIVFSSHNIEHQIDIIEHINNIERILNNDGYFACIIPNKKYTFDHYKRESTIFEIINEHIERQNAKQHSFLKYSNDKLFSTHNKTMVHWEGIHGEQKKITTEMIKFSLTSFLQSNSYQDIHSWIFTEDNFEKIFIDLFFLNITNLKLIRLYRTLKNSNSFFAIFRNALSSSKCNTQYLDVSVFAKSLVGCFKTEAFSWPPVQATHCRYDLILCDRSQACPLGEVLA